MTTARAETTKPPSACGSSGITRLRSRLNQVNPGSGASLQERRTGGRSFSNCSKVGQSDGGEKTN
jgi:hypothetical protein